MKTLGRLLLLGLFLSWASLGVAAESVSKAENIVLITLDGLRWQEVFRGIDQELAAHPQYGPLGDTMMTQFWHESAQQRARALMPFLHGTVFDQGSYVGNRDAGSCAKVSNDFYFSYPGYSEILSGVVNPTIDSNDKYPNPEKTFLELLNERADFAGSTAAFASWDVFPYIFNTQRSGIPVNAYHQAENPLTETDRLLNVLLQDIPSPWESVRLDAFTHHYAKSYLEVVRPRVIHIGYGETDDFAHDGDYRQYISAAHRSDRFVAEIWAQINAMEFYRGKTAMLITIDHGRGESPVETWQHHSSKRAVVGSGLSRFDQGIVGSEAVWMAAIGPGVANNGLLMTGQNCLTSNRIAATLMQLLGLDYKLFNSEMGAPMLEFLQ